MKKLNSKELERTYHSPEILCFSAALPMKALATSTQDTPELEDQEMEWDS